MFIEGVRGSRNIEWDTLLKVAKNDGLSISDFMSWFPKDIDDAQIICWDKKLKY